MPLCHDVIIAMYLVLHQCTHIGGWPKINLK